MVELDPVSLAVGVVSMPIVSETFKRVMGPLLSDRGDALLAFSRNAKAQRVVRLAERKLRGAEEGAIPARLAAEVLDQAQWADDEMVAEYLSGVLASGRTVDGVSDRALPWANLVRRLSADQLALHYSIYSGLRGMVLGPQSDSYPEWVERTLVAEHARAFFAVGWDTSVPEDLPADVAAAYLEQGQKPFSRADELRILEAAYGLQREGLLEAVSHGMADYLRDEVYVTKGRDIPEDQAYLLFRPTADGANLFLHGAGYAEAWLAQIADPDLEVGLASDAENLPTPLPMKWVEDYPMISAGV